MFARSDHWDAPPLYRLAVLGGVGEFGRNCMVIEDISGQMIVIDAGMMFPGPGLPGINRVIPDFGNLAGREDDVLALVITHGHEDHIGAMAQFLDRVKSCDILSTPLASGLFDRKLRDDHRDGIRIRHVYDAHRVAVGPFTLTFVAANHSIPQTLGVLVEIQGDFLYFTGDFRLDDSPLLGHVTNHSSISEVTGNRTVRFMFVDATNAGQDGSTRRESSVMTSIRGAFAGARGRIYFTTFASHIERQFLAISLAREFGRKVFVAGGAMIRNIRLATELGLHSFPQDTYVDRATAQSMKPSELLVLASGSQGEDGSFLDRLAKGTQSHFALRSDDLIIFSSVPIPGNEPRITRNIDLYMRAGADVLHYRDAHVHVSGHARNDEIGALINVVKPRCVVPVHGDHYNLVRCAELARRVGPYDTLVLSTGDVVEVHPHHQEIVKGMLSSRPVYVDDHSDDVPEDVVEARRILADQGLILVLVSEDQTSDNHELIDIQYVGFSGPPIDQTVRRAIEDYDSLSNNSNLVRALRDTIFKSIGGPRGRQAKIIVRILPGSNRSEQI